MKTKFNEFIAENIQGETITLYHGTNYKHINDIQQNGLVNNMGYDANWFMFSTDFESALFHATPKENESAYVFEFEIPYNGKHWKGRPYLWKEYKRTDISSWFAPMKQIPNEFIKNLHETPYDEWVEQKRKKY